MTMEISVQKCANKEYAIVKSAVHICTELRFFKLVVTNLFDWYLM